MAIDKQTDRQLDRQLVREMNKCTYDRIAGHLGFRCMLGAHPAGRLHVKWCLHARYRCSSLTLISCLSSFYEPID